MERLFRHTTRSHVDEELNEIWALDEMQLSTPELIAHLEANGGESDLEVNGHMLHSVHWISLPAMDAGLLVRWLRLDYENVFPDWMENAA